ncbi:hypothetical protein CONLIGDRAFT_29878 [Coniochaeta ligniaria NRRL 30616]|uniref:Uncharacterized protein n=1 Tax=Coniochaeta ligniaria NRRL 30616 TaxID=1408157 RepID=A0A1J7J6A2_9PEZI|nr:hypothetical protein CONLIGDRAFT_29878 [Coniochaeta ligniaria NRRL 30616]
MNSKNKHARPPPRKPWMLDNTSSSSLRGMEIGLAPGHKLPSGHKLPPPPADTVAAYETKPLPPIPTRRSGISSFSAEIQNAFRTPSSVDYNIPEVKPEIREASIAVILDRDPVITEHGVKVDSGYTFTETPVQDFHSLLPKGSVQKLLQITGAGSAASLSLSNTSLTPSGHNPSHKIKQIMGLEIPHDECRSSRGPDREISPLTLESRGSSIYSQDQEDIVSVSDIDSPEREQLSTPETSVTISNHLERSGFWSPASVAPSAIPASLHIVKINDRNTFGGLAPMEEPASPTTNNYSHANGTFRHDLYHATVAELAQSASSSSAYSQTSGNSDSGESTNFSYPGTYVGQTIQRHPSFANRTYQSKVRIAPPPSKLDTLRATRYNAPVKTPYPLPLSRFEFDDDDQTPTQRDYDSDILSKTSSRHPSLIDRIIRRTSITLSPTSQPTPGPELTPNTAIYSPASPAISSPQYLKPPPPLKHRSFKSHDNLRSHTTFSKTSTNSTAPTSRTATPRLPTRTRPPPVPPRGPPSPFTRLNPVYTAKPSLAEAAAKNLSAWAERTAERIEQARQAAGIRTRSERRREKIKRKIMVMGPGKLEADPAPVVVGSGSGKYVADGGAAPVGVSRGFVGYSDERAWAAGRNMI